MALARQAAVLGAEGRVRLHCERTRELEPKLNAPLCTAQLRKHVARDFKRNRSLSTVGCVSPLCPQEAQMNFIRSTAAYSLVCYLLQARPLPTYLRGPAAADG